MALRLEFSGPGSFLQPLRNNDWVTAVTKLFFLGIMLGLLTSCNAPGGRKLSAEENEVIYLIERMTIDEKSQNESLAKLEALGCKYAPYIVKHMDDRRALPNTDVTFENLNPNRFEAVRHYGVDLVVDALDALLNQMTGLIGYNYDYGRATSESRDKAVRGWKAIVDKYNGNLCGS